MNVPASGPSAVASPTSPPTPRAHSRSGLVVVVVAVFIAVGISALVGGARPDARVTSRTPPSAAAPAGGVSGATNPATAGTAGPIPTTLPAVGPAVTPAAVPPSGPGSGSRRAGGPAVSVVAGAGAATTPASPTTPGAGSPPVSSVAGATDPGAVTAAALIPASTAAAGDPGTALTSGAGFGARLAGEPAVGVNVHTARSDTTPAELNSIYGQLAAAGVTWVRIDLGWDSFESAPGQLTASYVQIADAAVNAARAHGLQVLATLLNTPPWANGNQANNVPPSDPADYAGIANWAAGHFAGRVAAWEIWNEEDTAAFWNPPNPAAYTALVQAAYPAIKRADPNAIVVLGGTSYNDTGYLAALYADGIEGSFDVLATHPYEGVADNPPATVDDGTEYTLTHVAAVHALMVQHGDANVPIWFTEFGWADHANAPGTATWQLGVSAAQQGDYLIETLRWVAQHAPYVTQVFWYEATNATDTDIQNANYGLLTAPLTPKTSYTLLQRYLDQ